MSPCPNCGEPSSDYVHPVVNTVFNGGIVKLWNAVAGLVPGVGKLSPIKGFATGGVYPECHDEYLAYLDGEAAPAPDRDDRDEGEPT